MFRDWNAVSVGYAQYYSIVMRTITFHTIHVHVGALENYTKSNNNYNKDVTRNSNGQYWGHGKSKCNVSIIFANIRTPKSTYYLLYDKSHSKTQYNYNPIFNILANFGFTN